MTATFWRAARSLASAPAGRSARRYSENIASSSRSIALLHRPASIGQPTATVDGGTAGHRRFPNRIHANRISTTAPHRNSAPPFSSFDDPVNNDAAPSASDSTPFLLADIGEGISEVELLRWFVAPGDAVAQFDRICEVQSDKAAVEITSRFDGVVDSMCGKVGDMMSVGKPLLYIATKNDECGGAVTEQRHRQPRKAARPTTTLNNVDGASDRLCISPVRANDSKCNEETIHDENASARTTSRPREHQASSTTKVLTSPAVRKMGKENGIDLSTVIGTGPGGRVLKADVLKIIESDDDSVASPRLAQEKMTAPTDSTQSQPKDTPIPIRGYGRLMVKSMESSLQIPHMVYADEVNVDALTEVRDALRPRAREMGAPRMSYMPFFVKAASLALKRHPALNSTIDVEGMTLTCHGGHDIGVAVDTERGLTVPVVRGCEDRSVLEIAVELGRLYSLAAEGNLSEADISRPTFTLSNIGAIGGTYVSPVVLPPQVAIGAMGKIQRLPRFVSDDSLEVVAARIMPISWGGDHRAVDGATMARFSNTWKSYCENPSSMMFAMR